MLSNAFTQTVNKGSAEIYIFCFVHAGQEFDMSSARIRRHRAAPGSTATFLKLWAVCHAAKCSQYQYHSSLRPSGPRSYTHTLPLRCVLHRSPNLAHFPSQIKLSSEFTPRFYCSSDLNQCKMAKSQSIYSNIKSWLATISCF